MTAQDAPIGGGNPHPASPDKPGTVFIAADATAADVAIETYATWTDGAVGLVFRWLGEGDFYYFSVGQQRLRLVRVQAGRRIEPWSGASTSGNGAVTLIAVQAAGSRIRCQVDEQLVCDIQELSDTAAPSGSLGLYCWSTTTAAFDEVRARDWPGTGLAPTRVHTAQLEASRPVFTDGFDTLAAFDFVDLDGATASHKSSALAGVVTVVRPHGDRSPVVALAGDPAATDIVIECVAHPNGLGAFGLVARFSESGSLRLQLVSGIGRSLVVRLPGANGMVVERVLWQDDATVDTGRDYALALRTEGGSVTVGMDGELFSASTNLTVGRFGMLSAIPGGGCEFRDLIVRSAPRTPVHRWNFTTSAYLGLPDLMDGFVGRVWPLDATTERTTLSEVVSSARESLDTSTLAVNVARAALSEAAGTQDLVDMSPLTEAALDAVAVRHSVAGTAYDQIIAELQAPRRPTPPVVELLGVIDQAGAVVALLLDLPEPLPWERLRVCLSRGANAPPEPDVVVAWSQDGTHAVVVRDGASPIDAGQWSMSLTLRLEVGAERAVWRRAGSLAPEVGQLEFTL
jgi:hypothetical protein